MPITLITGPANAGKAQVVMDAVRAHLAHGEEPLLVVPTRADAEHYLRELAGEGAAMGVRVSASRADRRGRAPRRRARAAARRARARAGCSRRSPRRTRAAARVPPGFVRALAGAARRAAGAPRDARAAARGARAAGGGRRRRGRRCSAELGRAVRGLPRDARAHRAPRRRAARRARARRAAAQPALWGAHAGAVLRLRRPDARCSSTRSRRSARSSDAQVTVSLAYEPGRAAFAGRAATFQALAPLAAEHRALRARADYYAPRLARRAQPPRALAVRDRRARAWIRRGAVRLLEGGGERAELELVAGEIARAARARACRRRRSRSWCARRRRAPTCSKRSSRRAGIPFALAAPGRFGDTAIGRALIGLLRCVPGRGAADAAGRARRPAGVAARAGAARAPRAGRLARAARAARGRR